MVQLDAELRPRVIAVQESLRRLSVLLNETQRSRGADVLASLESLKQQITRIQDLSHVNSDIYARDLTVTKTVDLADRCDNALANLLNILRDGLVRNKQAEGGCELWTHRYHLHRGDWRFDLAPSRLNDDPFDYPAG